MRKMTFARKPAQLKLARLREALAGEPMSLFQLAQVLCLTHEGCRPYVNHLHQPYGHPGREVYIESWKSVAEPGKRTFLRAFYALGNKRDAKRPASNHATYNKRYIARLKQDQDAYGRHVQRKTNWQRRQNFKPRADVAAQWLFREAA